MKSIYAKGSPFECGIKVGRECRDDIMRMLDLTVNDAKAAGYSWNDFVEKSKEYYLNIPYSCQMAMEFYNGVANGAALNADQLKAVLVEELYNTASGKCTNIVIGKLIGQNNDLSPEYKDLISHSCLEIKDFGKVHLIGPAGFYMSVGLNSHGLVLVGSELSPNDEKIGIPRSAVALSILFTKSMEHALEVSTLRDRSSSYHNVVINADRAVGVEASATDHELIHPDGGFLVHTNHYISNKMMRYESPDLVDTLNTNSQDRYTSAKNQCELFIQKNTEVRIQEMKEILTSHENGISNNSVCRHGEFNSTVFSFVYKYGNPYFEVAIGNPCENPYGRIDI